MDVMNIAEEDAKQKGLLRKSKVTQGWWREFLKRQDDLSLQKGDNLILHTLEWMQLMVSLCCHKEGN